MPPKQEPDVTVRARHAINKFLGQDFPPGPHCVPWYYIINAQKGGTLPFCLVLMHHCVAKVKHPTHEISTQSSAHVGLFVILAHTKIAACK